MIFNKSPSNPTNAIELRKPYTNVQLYVPIISIKLIISIMRAISYVDTVRNYQKTSSIYFNKCEVGNSCLDWLLFDYIL